MITRAYVVTMPEGEAAATPVDILVQDDPGSPADPVVGVGSYYEVRGRPIRFETVEADGVVGGFVPLMNLGMMFAITSIGNVPAPVPAVQLSESLSTLGADIGAAFADPNGLPAIRLTGSGDTEAGVYLVTVQIAQAQDEDKAPRRNG